MSQRTGKIFKLEFNNVPYKIGLQKKDGQKHFGGEGSESVQRNINLHWKSNAGMPVLQVWGCSYTNWRQRNGFSFTLVMLLRFQHRLVQACTQPKTPSSIDNTGPPGS